MRVRCRVCLECVVRWQETKVKVKHLGYRTEFGAGAVSMSSDYPEAIASLKPGSTVGKMTKECEARCKGNDSIHSYI